MVTSVFPLSAFSLAFPLNADDINCIILFGEPSGSGSVGSYETPEFLPKNSKNWRGGKKPIYKGGKFVEVKKKCLKFPYCNQGAGAIKIYENETLENVISSVSKKTGVEEQIIRRILYNNFKKKNKN